MQDNSEVILGEILKMVNDINATTKETQKELKEFREEETIKWEENNKRWDENDKKWEQNERRWEENDKRWEENERRWEENNKRWFQNETNRKKDKEDITDILLRYEIHIAEKLGEPNVEKTKKLYNIK